MVVFHSNVTSASLEHPRGASKAKSCRETDNQAWKMTCDSWQSHGGQTRNHSVGFREIFWLVVWYTYPSEKSWSEFVSWDDNPN